MPTVAGFILQKIRATYDHDRYKLNIVWAAISWPSTWAYVWSTTSQATDVTLSFGLPRTILPASVSDSTWPSTVHICQIWIIRLSWIVPWQAVVASIFTRTTLASSSSLLLLILVKLLHLLEIVSHLRISTSRCLNLQLFLLSLKVLYYNLRLKEEGLTVINFRILFLLFVLNPLMPWQVTFKKSLLVVIRCYSS